MGEASSSKITQQTGIVRLMKQKRPQLVRPSESLSPFCVCFVDGETVTLEHGISGRKYEFTRAELMALFALGNGQLELDLPAEARRHIRTLVPELRQHEILIDSSHATAPRFRPLDPLQRALHRRPMDLDEDTPRNKTGSVSRTRKQKRTVLSLARTSVAEPISLVDALRVRRSRREFSSRPVSFDQLSGLFEISCSARSAIRIRADDLLSRRPYPSGGGKHSLRVYPVIYSAEQVRAGAYCYDPFAHSLERIACGEQTRTALLSIARSRMGEECRGNPSLLLVITSSLPEVLAAYSDIGYHLVLYEVGALYQTLYLAAEQLRMAACALGRIPNPGLLDWCKTDSEAPVGFFALGASAADTAIADHIEHWELSQNTPFGTECWAFSFLFGSGLCEMFPAEMLRFEISPSDLKAWSAGRDRQFTFSQEGTRQFRARLARRAGRVALRIGRREVSICASVTESPGRRKG